MGKTIRINNVRLSDEWYSSGETFSTGNNYLYLGAVFQPPNISATLFLPKKIPSGKTLTLTGNFRLFTGGSAPISNWTSIASLNPTISYIDNTNIVRILMQTSITSGNWQNAILNISDGSILSISD